MPDETYEESLEREGRDLVAAARTGAIPEIAHRDAEVGQLLDHVDHGRSVLLVGPAGVGKSAVIHGAAGRMMQRGRGRIVELSTVTMLSGTRYLGEWESKVTQIVKAAKKTHAVLCFTDVWNLSSAGRTRQTTRTVLDALRPHVLSKELVLIGEVSPEMARQIEREPLFSGLFQKLAVAPLHDDDAAKILDRAAKTASLELDAATRSSLVHLTSRFTPARPQPGPALRLLEQVRDYQEQKKGAGEPEKLSPAFVEKVFSIYSGLPLVVVSRKSTLGAGELRSWFRERIVGQEQAIEAVVETIALFKSGLNDPGKPLGTLLFVGPTGVGKTEVARALATYLFGSAQRLLRFDMSELKDYHSFEVLIGSGSDPDRPAALIDPVRAQPFQVVLLDEVEKAHPNVWDLLLPLLDEGRLTPPGKDTVDFRSTIIIATSNAGAEDAEKHLGFGSPGEDHEDYARRIERGLRASFRPELLNRFQHIVAFHPLTKEQVRTVARQELKRVLAREGITSRNLVVEVDDEALDRAIDQGYQARFGARALKRELQRQLVLPLATTLMEREVEPGSILKVTGKNGRVQVRVVDTAETREARREKEPVKVAGGKKLSKKEAEERAAALVKAVEKLASDAAEPDLVKEQAELIHLRALPTFWRQPAAAAPVLEALEWIDVAIGKLDALRAQSKEVAEEIAGASRTALEAAARRLIALEADLAAVRRELIELGRAGVVDALVEVDPVGSKSRPARDLVVSTYLEWIKSRGFHPVWLREPIDGRDDEEPALLGVRGRFAFGLLRAEQGLHRVKHGDAYAVARVRVAPWIAKAVEVAFGEHRALKLQGVYGGKVRSRLEVRAGARGFVLQNERTLAENRDLAAEVTGAWAAAPHPIDAVARRYDRAAPLIHDALLDLSTGRPDALSPARFHELLVGRVDASGARSEP